MRSLFSLTVFILLMTGCSNPSVQTSSSHAQKSYLPKLQHSQTAQAKLFAPVGSVQRPLMINTEKYDAFSENRFKDVKSSPLSTLSIDVDTASYTNILRMIEDEERLPVKGAVRIEEMINYFTYDYPQPQALTQHPFTISTEMMQAPWKPENKLLLVGLQAKIIPKEQLPSSNFVALIDVSGSMRYDLPLVKKSLKLLARKLDKKDRLSIVNYATTIGITLEPTSGDQYEKIAHAIDTLTSYGGTDGESGIAKAYELARQTFIPKGNNRILMFTDGDFNVGRTSASEMRAIVEKQREGGVFLSIIGFGSGNYNDAVMEKMADNGNGNYAYVHDLLDAKKTFDTELTGTLYTLGKDVKFQLEFNPSQVAAYRLIGYENRKLDAEDFNDDSKDAGEIGVGHSVTALYELVTAQGAQAVPQVDALKYQTNVTQGHSNEYATIKMRYKKADGNTSQLMKVTTDGTKKATNNIKFASAVAGFGMILRDSAYKQDLSMADVVKQAKASKGKDEEGYRAAFIKLVEKAALLQQK